MMNTKRAILALGLVIGLAMASPLRAQSGCVDSPEDPTIVLALVGVAGAMAAGIWKAHRR